MTHQKVLSVDSQVRERLQEITRVINLDCASAAFRKALECE